MFGFSGGEVLFIALIALLLFGNDKLPENIKKMMKGVNQAKKVAGDLQKSWHDVKVDIQRSVNFEDEKNEILDLVKPIKPENYFENLDTPSPAHNIVSQSEIDNYMHSNYSKFPANDYNHGTNNNETIQSSDIPHQLYSSSKEYILSNEFVGPRC